MRVFHIMADGAPGGGPTVVKTLCEHLAARGLECAIVTQSDSHLYVQARVGGVQTFGFDFSSRVDILLLRSKLGWLFEQERPDLVHAHGARSTLPVALLRHRQRPPLVYTVHGFHYQKKRPLVRMLARQIEWLCIHRADNTVFVANADREHAQDSGLLGAARSDVIYNGVAVPSELVLPDAKRKYDIAFIGRLHPQKNPLILPDVLLAMRPKRPKMLIVAGGELESSLRAKIDASGVGAQVTIRPAMPRVEALAMLAQARVLLLPSLWEGLPVVLAEAMLLRVAVVASAIPGNDEIVKDGDTGYLAPAQNPIELAACITRLLNSQDERLAMTARAVAHAANAFSVDRQADAHLELFKSILEQRCMNHRV